jgi:hypothetical protein
MHGLQHLWRKRRDATSMRMASILDLCAVINLQPDRHIRDTPRD